MAIETKQASENNDKKERIKSVFPRLPLKQALILAEAIKEHIDGDERIKRLTLFDLLDRKPDSSTSRNLIIQSGAYGLTTGGYHAEYLGLTDRGKALVGLVNESARRRALVDALTENPVFAGFYERYKGAKVQSEAVIKDYLKDELKVHPSIVDECFQIILSNSRDFGLVRTYSGDERFVSPAELLDGLDLSQDAEEPENPQKEEPESNSDGKPMHKGAPAPRSKTKVDVCVNVQIVIPESADAAMIDNIFASMAKHLGITE